MERLFHANGKLLVSGEYLVLDGAKVLAVPTAYGQRLKVGPDTSGNVHWKSHDADGTLWFEGDFTFDDIRDCRYRTDDKTWCTLLKILHEATAMAPQFFLESGFTVETELTFPRFWGLGTSSTLICLVAKWLEVDPFTLSDKTIGGSGYDIACAESERPIFYNRIDGRPKIVVADFHPPFADNLYFVYLNRKQDSRAAVAAYYDKRSKLKDEVAAISGISTAMAMTKELPNFMSLMTEHERIISALLDIPVVKERLFHDFDGSVKSLGAWGGDFVMAASAEDPAAYFHKKGLEIVIPYRDMVK